MQRQKLKQIRRQISGEDRILHRDQLYQQFIKCFANLSYRRIASYRANDEEAAPDKIDQFLKTHNNRLYYPVLHPCRQNFLQFIEGEKKWRKNRFDLFEPEFNAYNSIAPWELDLVIAPLVGFDLDKNRLGSGGGYYDRSFAFKKQYQLKSPLLVGLAFDEQEILEKVAFETWDIKMDFIITPSRVIR